MYASETVVDGGTDRGRHLEVRDCEKRTMMQEEYSPVGSLLERSLWNGVDGHTHTTYRSADLMYARREDGTGCTRLIGDVRGGTLGQRSSQGGG